MRLNLFLYKYYATQNAKIDDWISAVCNNYVLFLFRGDSVFILKNNLKSNLLKECLKRKLIFWLMMI